MSSPNAPRTPVTVLGLGAMGSALAGALRGNAQAVRQGVRAGTAPGQERWANPWRSGRIPSGEPVATEELFTLHIDQAAGRSAPLPATARAHLTALVAPAPEWAGRGIREV